MGAAENAVCFRNDGAFVHWLGSWGKPRMHEGCARCDPALWWIGDGPVLRHGAFDASKAIATMGRRHPISLLTSLGPHHPRPPSVPAPFLCSFLRKKIALTEETALGLVFSAFIPLYSCAPMTLGNDSGVTVTPGIERIHRPVHSWCIVITFAELRSSPLCVWRCWRVCRRSAARRWFLLFCTAHSGQAYLAKSAKAMNEHRQRLMPLLTPPTP